MRLAQIHFPVASYQYKNSASEASCHLWQLCQKKEAIFSNKTEKKNEWITR